MAIIGLDSSVLEEILFDERGTIQKRPFINFLDTDEESKDKLCFYKINGMSMQEVCTLYKNKHQVQFLKMLKLATMFSANINMNETMFDYASQKTTLVDERSFLHNIAYNRNCYLFDEDNWQEMIRKNIFDQLDGRLKIEQIELEKEFQYTMLQFDVVQHIKDMMNFFKNEMETHKFDKLSLLYNRMYLEYQEILDEYEEVKIKNSSALMQVLTTDRLSLMGV